MVEHGDQEVFVNDGDWTDLSVKIKGINFWTVTDLKKILGLRYNQI
jgi:hypothetical protein